MFGTQTFDWHSNNRDRFVVHALHLVVLFTFPVVSQFLHAVNPFFCLAF